MIPSFLILIHIASFPIGKALAGSYGGFETRIWDPFPTDVTLLPPSSIRQETVQSSILCRMLGSLSKDKVNLSCYRDQECLLVSTNITLNRTTQTNGWSCHESQICQSSTGKLVTKGYEEEDSVCPAYFRRVCTSEGTRSIPDGRFRYERKSSCSPPFQETPYGCLYLNPSFLKACEARWSCFRLGGDLASPTSSDHFLKIVDFALQTFGSSQFDAWMGAFRWDGRWEYVRDGRSPGPYGQGDWGSEDPDNGYGELCSRLTLFKGKIILGDLTCSRKFQSICEVFF